MRLEVWTLPECERCERVKRRIRAANVEIVERDLSAVRRVETRDRALLTQSVMQDGVAPVIRVLKDHAVAGESDLFIEPDYIDDWLDRHAGVVR